MEGIDKVQGKRKKTRPPRGAARRSIHSHPHSHPFEVRRKAVQLYLEEGFSPQLIARQMGIGQSTLSKWVRLYRDHGEAGLKSQEAGPSPQRPKVTAAVKTGGRLAKYARYYGRLLAEGHLTRQCFGPC